LESEVAAGSHTLQELRISAGDEATFAGAENFGGMQADNERKVARTSGIESGGGVYDHQDSGAVFELFPGLDIDRGAEWRHDYQRTHRARHSL